MAYLYRALIGCILQIGVSKALAKLSQTVLTRKRLLDLQVLHHEPTIHRSWRRSPRPGRENLGLVSTQSLL